MHIPLAVALVDIDHFKVVNDTYGHLVGDKALRAVTDALRSQLRGYDLAGRFGGEEFVVLLPQAREQDALNVAERLRVAHRRAVHPGRRRGRVGRLRPAHHLGRRRVPGRREPRADRPARRRRRRPVPRQGNRPQQDPRDLRDLPDRLDRPAQPALRPRSSPCRPRYRASPTARAPSAASARREPAASSQIPSPSSSVTSWPARCDIGGSATMSHRAFCER